MIKMKGVQANIQPLHAFLERPGGGLTARGFEKSGFWRTLGFSPYRDFFARARTLTGGLS